MRTKQDHLRTLDRLVGTWDVSGESAGTVRYEWMDGGKPFDASGRVNTGRWQWPGGGYESTMTKSGS